MNAGEVIKGILTAEIERKQKEENLAKAEGVKIKKKKAVKMKPI